MNRVFGDLSRDGGRGGVLQADGACLQRQWQGLDHGRSGAPKNTPPPEIPAEELAAIAAEQGEAAPADPTTEAAPTARLGTRRR